MHSTPPYKLIVGLGNPGSAYTHTYHNAGALFVTFLVHTKSLPRATRKGITFYEDEECMLLLPHAFMNQTGEVIKKALALFRIAPHEMLVAHDDFDLPLGTTRLSFARGSAGHLGVSSIINALHTNRFSRLRIGVRSHPGKAGELVLARISSKDREKLERVFHSLVMTNSI